MKLESRVSKSSSVHCLPLFFTRLEEVVSFPIQNISWLITPLLLCPRQQINIMEREISERHAGVCSLWYPKAWPIFLPTPLWLSCKIPSQVCRSQLPLSLCLLACLVSPSPPDSIQKCPAGLCWHTFMLHKYEQDVSHSKLMILLALLFLVLSSSVMVNSEV